MPKDFNNTEIIQFYTQCYETEKIQRAAWFKRNHERIERAAEFSENYKNLKTEDLIRAAIELEIPSLSVAHEENFRHRRRKTPIDGPILGISQIKRSIKTLPGPLPRTSELMRPIEPNVSKILYTSLPEGGRRLYLKARKYTAPENKYYFCETSSVYGWRLKDSGLPFKPSTFGRRYAIKDTGSICGPSPDPKHYSSPPREPYSKC